MTIVVGASPGGTTDTLARVIGQSMATTLKRTVIVENKPGAGGNIAAQYVARSAADGNTLLMSYTSHTINATLFKNLPFDPVSDRVVYDEAGQPIQYLIGHYEPTHYRYRMKMSRTGGTTQVWIVD